MRHKRFGLSTALLFIAVVAVQLAWFRHTIGTHNSLVGLYAPAFDVGVVFPATILVATYHFGTPGRFKRGFLAGGLFALLLFTCLARYQGSWLGVSMISPIQLVASIIGVGEHGDAIIYTMDTIIFVFPQMMLALACGYLAKYVLPAPASNLGEVK